ncbi:AAA family ATPase [Devosia sp.]|jgi:cell division protease FtsH|uniref:AAA family ATPase n=1 Tax=Devosia sp. TaxID=1871048 RepID=UPI0037BEAFA8
MIDLIDSTHDEGEIPDFDALDPNEADDQRSAAEILANLALDAALTPKARAIIEQIPRLIIIKVPNGSWIDLISGLIRRMERRPYICAAAERRKSAGVLHRIGLDNLSYSYLQQGSSVLYISPDPDDILDEAVLAAADVTVEIAPPTPKLLRILIRRVTGGVARGITEQMSALDVKVIVNAVRPHLTAGAAVARLRAALGRRGNGQPLARVPSLTELPLTAPVRKWADQTLADLAAVSSGSISPDNLVYAVLEGPPGSGKSLIANSLAQTAGWNFVPATMGGWFTVGDGALGGVAKNVKLFIDQVLASAPAIGFLDELDAIPNRATMDNRGKDWWTPIVTLFLTEIDRLGQSGRPVLLLGATNYYFALDAALIRHGRMQQRVSVLPTETEQDVMALLHFYFKDDFSDSELGKLARLGIGSTPGMMKGWAKEARAVARAAGRTLQLDDLFEQMLPRDERTAEDIRTIAFHEIGHAVVAHRLGIKVEQVTIVPKDDSAGHTKTLMSSIVPTWERICDLVTTTLGGRAADIVLGSGPNAGAESDLANATTILLNAIERQGLRGGLVYMPEMGIRRSEVTTIIEAQLNRLLKRAIAIIETDRQIAIKLAERLIEERILSGVDIASALDAGLETPQESMRQVRATGGKQVVRPPAVAKRSA